MKEILRILFLGLLFFGSNAYAASQDSQLTREHRELEKNLAFLEKFLNGYVKLCHTMAKDCSDHLAQHISGSSSGPSFQQKLSQQKQTLGYQLEAIDMYIRISKEILESLEPNHYKQEKTRELQDLERKIQPLRRCSKQVCLPEPSGGPESRKPKKKSVRFQEGEFLTTQHFVPNKAETNDVYLYGDEKT